MESINNEISNLTSICSNKPGMPELYKEITRLYTKTDRIDNRLDKLVEKYKQHIKSNKKNISDLTNNNDSISKSIATIGKQEEDTVNKLKLISETQTNLKERIRKLEVQLKSKFEEYDGKINEMIDFLNQL